MAVSAKSPDIYLFLQIFENFLVDHGNYPNIYLLAQGSLKSRTHTVLNSTS